MSIHNCAIIFLFLLVVLHCFLAFYNQENYLLAKYLSKNSLEGFCLARNINIFCAVTLYIGLLILLP